MADDIISRDRLVFASVVFLGEMRRQAVLVGNDVDIKKLDEYPPAQRSAVVSAVEKAIAAASPAADAAYNNWKEAKDGKS